MSGAIALHYGHRMKLSGVQKEALEEILRAPQHRVSLDDLAEVCGNRGALSKALLALGFVEIESGTATLRLQRHARRQAGTASRFETQLNRNAELKRGTALFAANELVESGRARKVLIDNGTQPAMYFRAALSALANVKPAHKRPQISWVCLNPIVAADVVSADGLTGDVSVIGGELDWQKASFVGPLVLEGLRQQRFEIAVLGVARISTSGRVGQPSEAMVEQKKQIINKASHVWILVDESKVVEECLPGSSFDIYPADDDSDFPAALEDIPGATIARILSSARERRLTLVIGTHCHAFSDVDPPMRDLVTGLKKLKSPRLRVFLVDSVGRELWSCRES